MKHHEKLKHTGSSLFLSKCKRKWRKWEPISRSGHSLYIGEEGAGNDENGSWFLVPPQFPSDNLTIQKHMYHSSKSEETSHVLSTYYVTAPFPINDS